jgi:methionyl-tRNA formyltransferase
MRVAIIGRSEVLYETALYLKEKGHEIALIVTANEAPEYKKKSKDFKEIADAWSIPFIKTPLITKVVDVINNLPKIDLGVSYNYTGIIPQTVIDLFPMGILNAHGGDLPRYRGNACQAWAILNGENQIGLCVHRMIGGELDSGDIIARDYYQLSLNTKVTETYAWMSKQIPKLIADALKELEQDPSYFLEKQSKDPKDALRCYPRKPEDGRINLEKSNIEILRLINACNRPYAGAFCEFEGQKLIVWDAELAPEENFLAIPGQITFIGNGFIEVATGKGKLRIKEIEINDRVVQPNLIFRSIRQRLT